MFGRRGSAEFVGVRIRDFFGGLARSIRSFVAISETTDVASALRSRAYGHLAANTPQDRQLGYQLLSMAATLYRSSGRRREADDTLTMLRQVQGFAPLSHAKAGLRDSNQPRRDHDGR